MGFNAALNEFHNFIDDVIAETELTLSFSCLRMDCVRCSLTRSYVCDFGQYSRHHFYAQFMDQVDDIVQDIIDTQYDPVRDMTLNEVAVRAMPLIAALLPGISNADHVLIWHRYFVGDHRRCQWVLGRIAQRRANTTADNSEDVALAEALALLLVETRDDALALDGNANVASEEDEWEDVPGGEQAPMSPQMSPREKTPCASHGRDSHGGRGGSVHTSAGLRRYKEQWDDGEVNGTPSSAALNDLNASDASRPTIEAPVLSPQTLDFSEVADSVGDSAWSCDEFGFPLTRPRVAPRMPEVSGVATDFRFLMRNEYVSFVKHKVIGVVPRAPGFLCHSSCKCRSAMYKSELNATRRPKRGTGPKPRKSVQNQFCVHGCAWLRIKCVH